MQGFAYRNKFFIEEIAVFFDEKNCHGYLSMKGNATAVASEYRDFLIGETSCIAINPLGKCVNLKNW